MKQRLRRIPSSFNDPQRLYRLSFSQREREPDRRVETKNKSNPAHNILLRCAQEREQTAEKFDDAMRAP